MKKLLVAGILMVATGAQALECRVFDPAQRFIYAEESATEVVIVMGQFDVDGSQLPDCEGLDEGFGEVSNTISPGRFVGHGLTQDGFTTAMDVPVGIEQDCMGSGRDPAEIFSVTIIAFLDVTDRGYLLTDGLCDFSIYAADPATISQLTACMRGAAC